MSCRSITACRGCDDEGICDNIGRDIHISKTFKESQIYVLSTSGIRPFCQPAVSQTCPPLPSIDSVMPCNKFTDNSILFQKTKYHSGNHLRCWKAIVVDTCGLMDSPSST